MRKKLFAHESGLLSLEACIVVPIFIFLMLYMYSLFVIFEARNEVGHVLLTTSDSLSMDAYASKNLSKTKAVDSIYLSLFGTASTSNGLYTDTSEWYNETSVQEVVKQRFLAYLADGNKDEANRILEQLNVVGGFDGLDFSQSKIDDGDLYLVVNYKLEYEYTVFNVGTLSFQQSCCSKLWK